MKMAEEAFDQGISHSSEHGLILAELWYGKVWLFVLKARTESVHLKSQRARSEHTTMIGRLQSIALRKLVRPILIMCQRATNWGKSIRKIVRFKVSLHPFASSKLDELHRSKEYMTDCAENWLQAIPAYDKYLENFDSYYVQYLSDAMDRMSV